MKITETRLRRLIRSILSEAVPPPDEPSVAPDEALGQYVFPHNRGTDAYKDVGETDTDLETRFFKALELHYEANNNGPLRDVWPEVIELNRQGLYPQLLRAPRGLVYRLLTVTPDRAALFMGVSEEAIKARPGSARFASRPPSFKPRGFLSSWTLEPETMVALTGHAFVDEKPGECTLLLVADTADGEFLMNPTGFSSGWKLGDKYRDEYEVIGGGEIPLASAAWMWHGVSSFDMLKFDDELEALISGVSSDVKSMGPAKGASPEARRSEEQAIWARFLQGVEDAAKAYSSSEAGEEPTALKVVKRYLQNKTDFDEVFEDVSRAQGIESVVERIAGRWLVTAAGFLKSDLLMTIREVEGGHIGSRSPESILRQLLRAVE